MRLPVIFLLFPALLVGVASYAPAEVIHLKNGRIIWADQVRENGAHIEYSLGEDTYAIPKSAVDRIEAGGVPPARSSSEAVAENSRALSTFAPSDSLDNESALAEKVIHEDRVDLDVLSGLEKAGDPAATAAGYFVAGKHEFEHGNQVAARSYFQAALRYEPDSPTILNYYAVLLVRAGNAMEALPYAERSVRAAPDSPDALTVLGCVQFAADHNQDAMRTWKHALALRPDASVQKLLEKAQREASAEENYSQHDSVHFTLHYEGEQTTEAFRSQLLSTLESDYDDLTRELGIAPRNAIPVVLYTGQAFFDVTQAPSWSGAVNDGKLRIPVEGLASVTPQLARVLKHELAHSFINQLTGGRCPQWLNEGVAQVIEPKSLTDGRGLASLFQAHTELPFNALEGSFMHLSPPEATLAYGESLAAVQYISETYGIGDVQRILQRLGQGSSTEAALRTTIHADYRELDAEVGKYLTDRYGK